MQSILKISVLTFFIYSLLSFNLPEKEKAGFYTNLSEALKEPEKVISLKLTRKRYKSIPVEVLKFNNLEELNLSNNKLTEINIDLSKLKKLHTIELKKNRFEIFPIALYKAISLKKIGLMGNYIYSIPDEITSLVNLEDLDMYRNSVESVTRKIGELKKLKYLDLRMIEINEERQQEIKMSLPTTKIYFTKPCGCDSR